MSYTVNELAQLASISVRTLHYYDQVGLLKPAHVGKNGYRYYEDKELIILQQILFWRELEFSLDDIKRMLKSPEYSVLAALREQRRLFRKKEAYFINLQKLISKTINRMQNNKKIVPEEMYDVFSDSDVAGYQDEVRERWGNSEAYRQSMARVKKMTKAQMQKMKEDGKAFTEELAKSIDKGPKNKDVQALIEKHFAGINFFYDCSLEMYRNLGEMYVVDGRFAAYYNKFRPGLAEFMRDAINVFCDSKK